MKNSVLKVMAVVLLMGVAGLAHSASCAKGVCVVQQGDTLGSIGQQVNFSWQQLMKINGITDVKKVMVGQKIKYAADKAASSKQTPATPTGGVSWSGVPRQSVHYVMAGDTLYSISRATGVSVEKLISLNSLKKPYGIREGQLLNTSDVMYD
ncbi:LysM peptidoglycan-binding domain-containing protein [Thiothrix nivea]|uniref:Peptidoglycan-binding lysin domain-containing protein n=1 Tax=Thiothrix nivea (strain ATCC 35100 / DSM 5205 / JP2) TaxID=870187 RepID=A0A656HHC7_THINJ|nr:LysM domain-containing protein [Thiothrix nivea]EIJ35803.1 Peptidoglycan-binding lysin domain-containing protein [Thiothrix nivea DSM 5205]